jgi:hypothetical protein
MPTIIFSPCRVIAGFLQLSEERAVIPLSSINWLAFLMKMKCAFCETGTGFLNII